MQLHINTYGTYVHVKDDMFEIRKKNEKGEVEKKHYSALKVTGIVLATGSALSTDAIKLAMIHNVDILFIEQSGDPIGRVWHSKLGSTTKIRKRQLEASLGKEGLTWVKTWLTAKLDNQLSFIKDLKKHRPQHLDYLNDKVTRIEALSVSISSLDASTVSEIADTLRGLEGTAGRLYFETLNYVLPKEYSFNGRSMRPAKDAFNAFLNYAYGILYSKIEKALIVAGVDPYVGFMHRDDYNQLSMVFDFIEPYRAFADEVVFRLFSAKKVNKSHLDELQNGVSLNKTGKELLVMSFSKFMDDDPIKHRGRNLVRSHIIQLEAHSFANALIA
ncbi:CRISPR-associated endonuclease Cas1 [Runella sp. SP2]|uniref:CRISPR-associated endonuclease Cas1 n=1 Tax=Runella sp. SP2 TaxID=2268026 RepID=UPI000EE5F067|nr:CRISPR-associated endonuclease Cas1 [Runella sp. SP2]AYQ36655.1 CRISPR-associated endonuclease Cas1 [Runella sp. SP2]HAK78316.1 CRISPR-associated endonuclease Cas1 [Runella sp.]